MTPRMSALDGPPGSTLTELRASPTRRFIGVGTIVALGVLLIWIGLSQDAPVLWRLLLGSIGLLALWCGYELYRATDGAILLRPEGLFTQDGTPLAELSDIDTIERGAFAFKPSNGFSVKLRTGAPFAWSPGMYWRLGKRLGVGGVTSPGEAKAVAELLTALKSGLNP